MRKRISLIFVVLMVLVLISCSINERMLFNKTFIAKQNLSYVPINELIKNGPKYDGKLVLVFGYIYLGYGVSSVHYMEFDKKQVGDIKPGICVNLTDLQDINGVPLSESNYSNLKGKKVKLIGYYNYWDESRFLGECKGELSGIIYLSIID